MIEKKIKLYDKPKHINDYLTHWTGRDKTDEIAFENLSKIIDSLELKFSKCPTSFPGSEINTSNLMVCFTDTPLKQSLHHCKRYNYFGLSFNKKEMIEYGANPVLYIVENRKRYSEFMRIFFQRTKPDNNEESNLLSWIQSCFQPYDTKKFSKNNWAEFYEREWRIIRVLPFHWLETSEFYLGKNNEYPFKKQIRRFQKTDDINDEEFYLSFDKKIIQNVIVPSDFDKSRVIELMNRNKLDCELIIIEK